MTYIARNTPEVASVQNSKDTAVNSLSQLSFLEQLSPKSALLIGLVTSMLVICSLGFIFLLTLYFKSST